ncbi:MAG: redoxin domain-containing protein, partial [candidate division Zixibacteria bacterium]|nr:redoxin domain-containing protein [candidate division Zixibacteria bacterium]
EIPMARMKSSAILVLGGAVVVLAYVIGVQAAALFEKWNLSRNADQYHAQAAEQTASVLKQMGTIEVGDTLPNFPFEDIDGKVRLLSEVVTDKTLITYIKPDCDACLAELERLKQAATSQTDYEHVLLVSSSNPVHMQKLRAEYGLGCVILYDEERRFGSLLKISSFPFNLVVNRQRVIKAIHANVLLPDDYEQFFDEARSVIGLVPCPADVLICRLNGTVPDMAIAS